MLPSILKTTFVLLFISSTVIAQSKYKVDVEHVTVFLTGAEITSSAKITLKKGNNEILFTNIGGNIDQQSISLSTGKGVVVQSIVFQNNYLENEILSPLAKQLKDSIEIVEIKRGILNNKISVINEQISILSQNKQVSGSNSGLSVAELQKMLDLVQGRLGALLNNKDEISRDLKKTDEQLALLRQQYEEEKRKYFQPGGQLLVSFYCENSTTTTISMSYVTRNAGWTPAYDVRVDNINSPVRLYYKAEVHQNSGISWDNVKISLSTGNPNEGSQAPVLSPWYLSFYQPYQPENKKALSIAGAREAQPLYTVDDANTGISSMNDYVQVDNSGVTTIFDINIPYTIASDGKSHNVAIKEYELPATYAYYVVPKLDKDAFLQAKITNWETLDLLPATTNIFYEGTYVGKGYIDMRTVEDTMNISLGRDKKIIVKRERDKEQRIVRTIGTNIKETFIYTISIRNTRTEPVGVTVIDQVPVSNDKDIVVEDKEFKGAEYNETTGEVKWTINLAPGETKKLEIGYTVKYPRGKQTNL